jgi:hypothetical protein
MTLGIQAFFEILWTALAVGGIAFSIFVLRDAHRDRRFVLAVEHPDPRDLSITWSALAQEYLSIVAIYVPGLIIGGIALLTPNPSQLQPLGIALSVLFCLIMGATTACSGIRWHSRRVVLAGRDPRRDRRKGD